MTQILPWLRDETLKVLLIDDDDVDRELIRRFLDERYDVREAADLSDVPERLDPAPDVILLDHFLGAYDSMNVLRLLGAGHPPVILLSGQVTPELSDRVRREGVHAALDKGEIDSESLRLAISAAVEFHAEPSEE